MIIQILSWMIVEVKFWSSTGIYPINSKSKRPDVWISKTEFIYFRRRFLRKPNVTEACESFTSLAKHCESLELPAYAGLCWIAVARCEGSLLNSTEETACLLNSGRQFMRAETNDFNLGCHSVSGEYLQVYFFLNGDLVPVF